MKELLKDSLKDMLPELAKQVAAVGAKDPASAAGADAGKSHEEERG